jgi:hypothetical protein
MISPFEMLVGAVACLILNVGMVNVCIWIVDGLSRSAESNPGVGVTRWYDDLLVVLALSSGSLFSLIGWVVAFHW